MSLRFPILWVSASVKTAVLSVNFIVGFRIHPLGRKCVHCYCIMEVTEEEGVVGQGTPTGRGMAPSPLLSGVPRIGMCPGRYKNAEECAPATTRGTSWGNKRLKDREKASDRKDQTVFLNLVKLKVDIIQSFNTSKDRKDVTSFFCFVLF